MDTNLYCTLRGTYNERKEKLEKADSAWLQACILDSEYNDFLRAKADYKDNERDPHGHGKQLPYIGWYWRHLEFSEGNLPIGDTGDYIGFMANNKWDYPERATTPEEFAHIMEMIDDAMRESEQGGLVSDIQQKTNAKLDELWEYLQTLTI